MTGEAMLGRVERVLATGNLEGLSEAERVEIYRATCASLGLNPASRPLEYVRMQGRTVLYVRKEATDQLRRVHGVSIRVTESARQDDLYVVRVEARIGDRIDEDMGVVPIGKQGADALANAMMRALSKAKRRVTLSIVGLGWAGAGDDEEHAEDAASGARVEALPDRAPDAGVPPSRSSGPSPAPHGDIDSFQRAVVEWRDVMDGGEEDVADLLVRLRGLRASGALTGEAIMEAVAEARRRRAT